MPAGVLILVATLLSWRGTMIGFFIFQVDTWADCTSRTAIVNFIQILGWRLVHEEYSLRRKPSGYPAYYLVSVLLANQADVIILLLIKKGISSRPHGSKTEAVDRAGAKF